MKKRNKFLRWWSVFFDFLPYGFWFALSMANGLNTLAEEELYAPDAKIKKEAGNGKQS